MSRERKSIDVNDADLGAASAGQPKRADGDDLLE